MRLADRMALIGSESAFEAAARARALEAGGRSIIHLEIGEPDFDTPANHVRISYANSRENLADAIERIRTFVGGLGG